MEPQYNMTDFIGRTIQVEKNVKNYPWEPWYDDRTYVNDAGETTRWFPDGSDMTITVDEIVGDGIPDNPGEVIWEKPVRTGQQDNLSTNIGISATLFLSLLMVDYKKDVKQQQILILLYKDNYLQTKD